jgi:hypothetical protein
LQFGGGPYIECNGLFSTVSLLSRAASVYASPVKKRLSSFAYLLPLIELLFGAVMVLAPALLFFFRLKQMAHGAGSVSLSSEEFAMTIPSDRFLAIAFDRAAWWAAKAIFTLDAPAKFVEVFVSLVVAHTTKWYPASMLSSTWQALIYPTYALPAWFYVGRGIDAAMGRCRVRGWNAVVSVFLALTFAVLSCGLRFGMTAEERRGQELLGWFIRGFAVWGVLFAIPFSAWLLQKKRNTSIARDETLPSELA